MTLDAETLARIQFAFTVSFHIVFPATSIGLACFLAITEGLWLRTRDALYLQIYKFWLTIFAMSFGIGVVTGIVLSFEFGTNFARFGQIAGPVIGPMIALEVLTAFFLEAGFLGVMLFGMGRVGKRLHFAATCLVALGTMISASWIMSSNSWMQTPAGVETLANGKLVVTGWWAVINNPSWKTRALHMIFAAWLSGCFLVAGIGAWYILKRRHLDFARRTVSLATGIASIVILAQVFIGDQTAEALAPHQPSKFLAIEGHWDDTPRAPYLFVIVPDEKAETNRFEWGIPLIGSFMVTHHVDATLPGMKHMPRADRPNMALVFYPFRVMFVIALAMFALAAVNLWLRLRGKLFTTRWYLRALVVMTPMGLVATVAGWWAAEFGRQPWVIFGKLRTADAVSPVAPEAMLTTLLAFVAVYGVLLAGFVLLLIAIVRRGPRPIAAPEDAQAELSGSLKRALMPNPTGGTAAALPQPAE
jgi:cytochrome d ubiquinol oxidase subunit I